MAGRDAVRLGRARCRDGSGKLRQFRFRGIAAAEAYGTITLGTERHLGGSTDGRYASISVRTAARKAVRAIGL
jgi:hypothetical protein